MGQCTQEPHKDLADIHEVFKRQSAFLIPHGHIDEKRSQMSMQKGALAN